MYKLQCVICKIHLSAILLTRTHLAKNDKKRVYVADTSFCRRLRSSIQWPQGVICKIHLFAILLTRTNSAKKLQEKGVCCRYALLPTSCGTHAELVIGCIYHIDHFAKVLRTDVGCIYQIRLFANKW